MFSSLRSLFSAPLLLLLLAGPVAPVLHAQQTPIAADTTKKYENPGAVSAPHGKPWYQGKLVKATIVPAVLIGYGISTINGNGFYSSYQAKSDLRQAFPNFRTRVDDFLIFAPYLELGGALLAGVESQNDRLNLGLLILKGELIMTATTFATKYLVHNERPDGSDNLSFPSGHTAHAFLAASIVHTEFRDKSQWYGIGAYTIATGVGALRMLNNKHWESDVVAGAGFGILSAHLAYLSHRNRWGRKPRLLDGATVSPFYLPGGAGLVLRYAVK